MGRGFPATGASETVRNADGEGEPAVGRRRVFAIGFFACAMALKKIVGSAAKSTASALAYFRGSSQVRVAIHPQRES